MSADLFAEFGVGPSTSHPSRAPNQQAVISQTSSLIPDFDIADQAFTAQSSNHLNGPTPSYTQQQGATGYPIRSEFNDFGDFEQPQQPVNGNDVLFDATLESFSDDGSDDWGEFETAEAPPTRSHLNPPEKQKAMMASKSKVSHDSKPSRGAQAIPNLLDSLDTLSMNERPSHNNRPSNKKSIDDALTIGSCVSQPQPPRPKLPMEEEPFEEWGDFTDGPIQTSQPSSAKTSAQQVSSKSGELSQPTKAALGSGVRTMQAHKPVTQSTPTSHVRPTNIPPPSILLGLFPRLFEQLRQEGTKAKKKAQQKESLGAVALSIICTLKAVARVVAGRTLRWKRDAILSQSMRIGPARSGKVGGMKLSTVTKNEDIKEQQEAVDVINMWRDRAALFNSVIQAAGRRPVQVVSETTRVTTATLGQGAIKASHACALCGLKRDERIPKLDENVEDSFGEWWTEHWGHTECRHFWEDNMGLLGQR
ncbi:hypothetical protein ASPCAL03952 [Aspergillus calidoustus]|uniref:Serine/threonine-protein kinase ppk6 n=1 Tax=Aspergillus calidoustus TaxID=454130 RepID=A0A0U4YZP4_ASPCI|nr:hypothetical protein ASPCAL03952 [Aspergillus calidoustus]